MPDVANCRTMGALAVAMNGANSCQSCCPLTSSILATVGGGAGKRKRHRARVAHHTSGVAPPLPKPILQPKPQLFIATPPFTPGKRMVGNCTGSSVWASVPAGMGINEYVDLSATRADMSRDDYWSASGANSRSTGTRPADTRTGRQPEVASGHRCGRTQAQQRGAQGALLRRDGVHP